MLQVVALLLLVCWLLYKGWIRPYDYWRKRGIPHLPATFPWGSSPGLSRMDQFQGTATQDVYNRLAPHPYGGIVVLRRPYLVLRDPDIIKMIMVKDFDYFRDRTTADNIQEPISEHIFNLAGDKWRVKRVHLGPIFTEGRMKAIFPLFDELKEDLYNVLDKIAESDAPFDAKDTMSRLTIDFVGSWAFGSRIDSLKNNDHVLHKTGPQMFPAKMDLKIVAEQSVFNLVTGIEDYVRFPFIPPELSAAVDHYTRMGVEEREKSGSKRPDLVDTLIKLRNQKVLTTDRIVLSEGQTKTVRENRVDLCWHDLSSEALILFAAGFDTSSTMISTALFEIAGNTSIQDRLIEEIDTVLEKHGGQISYQALREMIYLDQVVSETARKYPPVPVLTRKCTRQYPLDEDRTIEVGTRVIIPLMAVHNDPRHFPHPERFIPERFAPENKGDIHPYTYFPFGEGPRYCIGKRIGLIQAKMGLLLTLSRYRVLKSAQTQEKIKFEPTLLVLTSQTPIWLKLHKRTVSEAVQ